MVFEIVSEEGSKYICSEERILMSVRETRIRLFMQIERDACREEFDWLIKCYLCAVNVYPKEYSPQMPLPVPPDYDKKIGKEGANGSEEHLAAYS